MRYVSLLFGLFLWLSPLAATAAPSPADPCQFVLGFQSLEQVISTQVGQCLDDVHYGANGDGLQDTTGPTGAGALLVWRKADNWTAFTDGYRTWVNGPFGVQERLNTQRFGWESDHAGYPLAGSSAAIAPTPLPTPVIVAPVNVAPASVPGNGATAMCRDGTLSYSATRSGTCSHHQGVATWYQ